MSDRSTHKRKKEKGSRYAFDERGNLVDARDTEYKRFREFTCDCPGKHRMRLGKPSGTPGKRPFADYFAHITPNKKHKSIGQSEESGQDVNISCKQGGESLIHKSAKYALMKLVGTYTFVISRCRCCNGEVVQDTTGCTVSIEVVSNDKRHRYDCLLKKEDKAVVAMEVVHTHLSDANKINSVRANGLEIVEFRADDVIAMESCFSRGSSEKTKLENIKIRTEICHSCLLLEPYKEEVMSWNHLEKIIRDEYTRQHKQRKFIQQEIRRVRELEERRRISQKLKEEEEIKKNEEMETLQKRALEAENKRPIQNEERLTKSEKSKPRDLNAVASLINGAPSFIYKSVYHQPDGSASWTPYEMFAVMKAV